MNLAAAEGHPASVMDMSFAVQALSVEHWSRAARRSARASTPVPGARSTARSRALKLASLGVGIDMLTRRAGATYLRSWAGPGLA